MAHKLRRGLSEDPNRPLCGFLEADETFIRGRGDPTSRGRRTANPDNSLVVAAVERCRRRKKRKHGHAARRQHGFFAGDARIAVLSAATSAKLGPCLKANVATGAHLLTDGSHLPGYKRQRAAAALMLPATTGAVDRLGRLVEGNLTGDPVYCDTQQTLPGFRP